MEGLPGVVKKVRLPLEIQIDPYLMDHHVGGRAVLPAVEAMQLLAESTKTYLPHVDVTQIHNARFDKFFYTDNVKKNMETFNEIEVLEDGNIHSKLLTKVKSKKTSITRTKEHVALGFGRTGDRFFPLPLDFVSALEGISIDVPPRELYRDLVPFGPAYHNITDILFISEKGAVAKVQGGDIEGVTGPLGSPFPLDAAFHAACVWGQRYFGVVGFPVGFCNRLIINPTCQGGNYIIRVIPGEAASRSLIFDIWIYDQNGIPHEKITGLQLRDVSGGKTRPPGWITNGVDDLHLGTINNQCLALSLIELKTINGLAEKTLSDDEKKRFRKMGSKRGRSYLGARLCCKSLFRQLSGNDRQTPASSITTVSSDGIRPRCPVKEGNRHGFCSVSHDSRFAVAVAAEGQVGIDVEEISERVLKSQRFYMKETERLVVHNSRLDQIEASLRVWTIKEAVSKAFDMGLADAWERVLVLEIGENKSSIEIDKKAYTAFHDTVDNHLFTVVNSV